MRQENKMITKTCPTVFYKSSLEFILNIGQMHVTVYLIAFKQATPKLDQDNAILSGITREINSCKKKKTASTLGRSSNVRHRRLQALRGGLAGTAHSTLSDESS